MVDGNLAFGSIKAGEPVPLLFSIIDFPFSLVVDTIALPVTVVREFRHDERCGPKIDESKHRFENPAFNGKNRIGVF